MTVAPDFVTRAWITDERIVLRHAAIQIEPHDGAGMIVEFLCHVALAADRGMAVLINLPYGRGRTFEAVGDAELPDWARGFADTWGQFFLKWIVAHPAVTCAIPGTYKMQYLEDNLGAAMGELPDEDTRKRMVEFVEAQSAG